MSLLELAYGLGERQDEKLLRQLRALNLGVAAGGSHRRRFASATPPSVTVAQQKTATANGFEFKWRVVKAKGVKGYNIMRSLVNNPNVAEVVDFVSQPYLAIGGRAQTLKWQEQTTENPFYWVQTIGINGAVAVGTFIPMLGAPAPVPQPNLPDPIDGGGSGDGSGGGGGHGGEGLFPFSL